MNYLDQSVYTDVEQEARAHWLAERPDPDYDYEAAQLCDDCQRGHCVCEVAA
jgi:hypothetical protein